MARPVKNNVDYFSHDSGMRNDIKIKALRRKFSHKGYSVWNMLLEHLSNCEYLEYEWSELNIELLTPDFDIDMEELDEIVQYCIKLGLLKMTNGYLHSEELTHRMSDVLSRRANFCEKNSARYNINSVNVDINPVIVDINTQSKVKESKVNESIEKQSILKETKLNETKHLSSFEKDQLMLSVSNWKLNKDLENAVLQLVEGMATPIQKDLIKKNKVKFEGIGVLQKVFNEVGI